MATATASHEPQHSLDPVLGTARALFVALLWSAFMLVVLGFWNRAKYAAASPVITYIFLAAGVIASALALWQAFTLWIKTESPEQKTLSLKNQHTLMSYVLMVGGVGLIVMAVVLGIGPKGAGKMGFVLENFAESCGVFLFGLIALVGGFILGRSSQTATGEPIHWLTLKLPILKLVPVVLGAAAIILFAWLFFGHRKNDEYLEFKPEFGALIATSILCFACLLWLNTGEVDDTGTRLFVLIFGGGIGLILFLYSFARSIYWRQDIYLGGIAAWQGENAWHFWLCAYLQFIALIVMFASFSIAKTDIRGNVVLRRVMYGYDTLLQALLLVEILAVLNVVVYAQLPYTYDWTQSRGAYALSDSTKNLISKLNKETHFIVLMPQNDPAFRDVRNLMNNCRALSNKLQVDYVSPDNDPQKYALLARSFPVIQPDSPFAASGRGVLLVYGPMPQDEDQKPPHSFISERRILEEDRSPMRGGGRAKRIFKGEEEIIKELKFLIGDQKKRKIYILQGDDEPDVNGEEMFVRRGYSVEISKLGFGALVEKLTKDNLDVIGLNFGKELVKDKEKKQTNVVYVQEEGPDKRKAIPNDCETLIVAGVFKTLPPETIGAIEKYMDRGGKMLVCLDVFADQKLTALNNTGLEPLLKQYGVEVTDTFCMSVKVPLEETDASTLNATAAEKSDHPLARPFVGRAVLMRNSARALATPANPGRFKAEPVLQLLRGERRASIVEKDVRVLRMDLDLYIFELAQRNQLVPRINASPINTVAVAVTDTKDNKPRMVVVGDTEFMTNVDLRNPRSQSPLINYSFVASALEWMAEREGIGAIPNTQLTFSIDPTVDTLRMVLLPGWLMFLSLVGLGICVWIVRRR